MTTAESKSSLEKTPQPKARKGLLGRHSKEARRKRRLISQTYWAQEQRVRESGMSLPMRMDLLSKYGDFSMAYSTAVQPRLNYFGDADGYLAYRQRWGMSFVLGDVVASTQHTPILIDRFIEAHKRLSFCQITRPLAELLSQRGFFINEMGVDTTLRLSDYSFAGKHKEWLRYAANWTAKRDFEIVEAGFDQITPDDVEKVSEAWRTTRTVKRKEVRFLNRPIVLEDELGVRKFFLLSPEKKLLAFVFLDPIFRDGKTIGYVTAFKRRHPEAPLYAEHAIMKRIIETLKLEGVEQLNLGLSPMAGIQDNDFRCNRVTSGLFRRAFDSKLLNKYCYNVVGHADYKRRFRGEEEKVYFASQSRFNSSRLLALIGLCGIA